MAYAKRQVWSDGVNPTSIDGPVTLGSGLFYPQFDLGAMIRGDRESEYVYCQLVLGTATILREGQAYTFGSDWVATLLTTANSPRGQSVGIGRVDNPVALAAGTYYIWLQINGECPVRYTGSNNALGETTATGGLMNFNNTPTSTTKKIVGIYGMNFGATFTADTVNGSPILQNISSFANPCLGATLTGTGVGGFTTSFIYQQGELSGVPIGKLVNTIELASNATATGSTITMTQTVTGVAKLFRPYIDLTNP